MKTIEIIDSGQDKYTLKCDTNILGRRYDNIAETLTIVKPAAEVDSACILVATYGGNVVDHIAVQGDTIDITSNLSQYESINIGFSFSRPDGYVKGSEIKQFKFLPAPKPDGFVPVPSEQKATIDYLAQYGFVDAVLDNNVLKFKNYNGDDVKEVQSFTSGGSSSQTFTDINSAFQFIQTLTWEKINKLIFIPTNIRTFSLSSNIITIPIDGSPSLQTATFSYAPTIANTPIIFYPQTKEDGGFNSYAYQFSHNYNNANLVLSFRTTSDGSISSVTAIGNFVNTTSSLAAIGYVKQTQFQSNLVGSFIVCYET